MLALLWIVPALPLAGFLILTITGKRMPRRLSTVIGVGSIGLAAVLTCSVALSFLLSPPPDARFVQTLWTWFAADDVRSDFGLHLDALSLVMILVVTFVGFLIHYYSIDFMSEDKGYPRFFAYMNLFVASMLLLVLADNLALLLVGWEGVGLCSYLLIGFWYDNPDNGKAAVKAFIVTRIGDVALLIGIFLIFVNVGSFNIQQVMGQAGLQWQPGSSLAVWTALLLLIGAIGKSAQLPLQVWLPDAMAGPTPVSALIHAATMVAAGVYLVARMHGIFILAPSVQLLIAVLGVATILLAGLSALAQEDLKRVLAYSTISQIGYMFLALGVGAWSAAVFHFLSHAFFKALLFLCAGAVILSLHHETSMVKMGGLRKKLPLVYWTFLIGALTTSGIPPTAGFASKSYILYRVWRFPNGGTLLWLGALAGVLITSLYSFRMVFLTFFGEARGEPSRRPGFAMRVPLVILGLFCFLIAALDWPAIFGGLPFFSQYLEPVLPSLPFQEGSVVMKFLIEVVAIASGALGIFLAWLLFLARPELLSTLVSCKAGALLRQLCFSGWGFDWLYNKIFIAPFNAVTQRNRRDFIDRIYDGVVRQMENLHGLLSLTQTGNLRWYAMSILLGVIFFVAVVILL